MQMRSVITGCGSYIPDNIVTNDDLSDKIETSHEWIMKRTGIAKRHVAAEDQMTSDLALIACQRALEDANLTYKDIDLLICATTTPDRTFPSTATIIQHLLGGGSYPSFDIQAVCSGFIYALSTADALLKSGGYKRALVVGAETFTRLLNIEDRGTYVLFGDGAGAVVLEAQQTESRGIIGNFLASDGGQSDILCMTGGVSKTGDIGRIHMEGKEVFRQAVQKLSSAVENVLEQNNMTHDDIDWFIPHQANRRIIDATARHLNLPQEKIIYTVEQHANTSAASIPLALDHAKKMGCLKKGDVILMDALGAGLTWGASLARW